MAPWNFLSVSIEHLAPAYISNSTNDGGDGAMPNSLLSIDASIIVVLFFPFHSFDFSVSLAHSLALTLFHSLFYFFLFLFSIRQIYFYFSFSLWVLYLPVQSNVNEKFSFISSFLVCRVMPSTILRKHASNTNENEIENMKKKKKKLIEWVECESARALTHKPSNRMKWKCERKRVH